MATNVYTKLFENGHSGSISRLWDWQEEVLAQYAELNGDAAVELPTGAGKTLIGLLVGEHHRVGKRGRVAYLAGNKQLAQQVERQAGDCSFPVVRFEGRKDGWDSKSVRAYNFGQAIGVMNYWNYFNNSPGIEPADMLILDDVHLLEGPLRDMFTVGLGSSNPILERVLQAICDKYPYYSRAEDLLNNIPVTKAPEMLAFTDSAALADEVRDLLDVSLGEGSSEWWAWQSVREHLEACCWLVSDSGITFTPYIPPTQVLPHFHEPSRRFYLSATIGSVDDLQRRLGAPPLDLLQASAQPMQGERLAIIRAGIDELEEAELVAELQPILEEQKKALWLCARKETAANLEAALVFSGLEGRVRKLEGDNAADEPFAKEKAGHLVTAGRYDGMDFPGATCRLEVIPEVPVATSDLEEFISAFLRDAPFAQARFAQRVTQALGRCNRTEDDRAVYLLTDPEFVGRFSRPQTLDALPQQVREDVYAALVRSDDGFESALEEARRFLAGEKPEKAPAPEPMAADHPPSTAAEEVEGILALWAEDFRGAADTFDKVAAKLSGYGEYRGFWLAMRALALKRAADFGERMAERDCKRALNAAAAAGGKNVFFTRLRHSQALAAGNGKNVEVEGDDDLFAAWDRLMDRHGTAGPRFERWTTQLQEDLHSDDHDTVARVVAAVGVDILGLSADAPQATRGEEDAYWKLVGPRRLLTFEVKLAPQSKRVVNEDIEQAEGAARAAETDQGCDVRGMLITPHHEVDETATARLERVRLLTVKAFAQQVEQLLAVLRSYRREWGVDTAARTQARENALAQLPPIDWLWRASLNEQAWIERKDLDKAWSSRSK